MKFLKKILSHPLVKKVIPVKMLKKLLIILTGVGAIVLIVKWYKKKKQAQQETQKERKLAPSSLVRVWKEFVRRIPRQFRRAIVLYQPAVVLGEAAGGKSLLIEKYTDWKGQSYQFYPSLTENPDIQIYLGARVLAQEIAAPVLNDTSPEARTALIRLWDYSLYKRDPLVVTALNADALSSVTPDSLKRQAQMIRGKVNIISQLQKKPPTIRIVLTHMDRLEGFLEFSKLLQKHNIPLRIDLHDMDLENGLKDSLEPYEKYLPLALTTQPARDYKALIKFFTSAPDMLQTAGIFLSILRERDPLTPALSLSELYLISNTVGEKVSNPFAAAWPEEIVAMADKKVLWHRVACWSLLVSACLVLCGAFLWERREWVDAKNMVAALQFSPSAGSYSQAQQRIATLTDPQKHKPYRIFWPSFSRHEKKHLEGELIESMQEFYLAEWKKAQKIVTGFVQNPSEAAYQKASTAMTAIARFREVESLSPYLAEFSAPYEKELKTQFINGLRNFYLLPIGVKCLTWSDPQEKTLYLLSLLYASRNNYLGTQILGNLPHWSKNLELPEKVIREYIAYSDEPWNEWIPLTEIPKLKKDFDPAEMPDPWISYFLEIEKCFQLPFITPEYLEKIQEEGKPLAEVIYAVERYALAQNLFTALDRETRLNVRKVYEPLAMTGWISKNHEPLKLFFHMLGDTRIVTPRREHNRDLPQFMNNLQTTMLLDVLPHEFHFALEGKIFRFTGARWHALIQNSKIVLLLEDFITQNQDSGDRVFFSGRNLFEKLEMNPYNDGTAFFRGKREIDGHYTRSAYDKELRPVLEDFDALLQKLPIAKNKKDHLANFIFTRAGQYAANYRNSYEEYYQSFDIYADSVAGLHIILSQMPLPASPFADMLKTVVENTALARSPSPYLNPLAEELAVFNPLHRLLQNKDNLELQKYYAILQSIDDRLEDYPEESEKSEKKEKKEAEKDEEDDFTDFLSVLPPAGRLTLPMLLEEKESYLALTRTWLNSVGLSGEFQEPFLAPVYQLYDLGLSEIEKTLHANWNKRVFPTVVSFLAKFPLNPKSRRDATPLELETAVHPIGGTFWQGFHRFIAPVCTEENGKWSVKKSLRRAIEPPDMLPVINHLARLSRNLWDKEGNPVPIPLKVMSYPLTLPLDKTNLPTFSCISAGSASVFNFNQQPAWQEFPISWWKQETASVILQLTNPETKEKKEHTIVVHDTLWSFFKLLQKAKTLKKNEWIWGLPEGASEYSATKVQYVLDKDPWPLLALPDEEDNR